MSTKESVTYKDAGVDIDAGEEAVRRIAGAARRTHIPGVMGGLGGFGGLFALKEATGDLDEPILVSGTDGVGTKLLVAIEAGRHSGVGQDLVAMCVNDILTVGARPLFFLDYFATGQLSPEHMAEVVEGIARACEFVGCALLGGETAELPGLYQRGEYDLAGFAVGVVEKKKMIDGRLVQPGDRILGMASSGLHSNGLSLARKIIFERMEMKIDDPLVEDKSVADVLLEPTRLYVPAIMKLLSQGAPIHSMAHITGGGLPGNLTRGFPQGTAALIDSVSWAEPAVFGALREGGPVEETEMRRAFNLGIGFCLVVPREEANAIQQQLVADGYPTDCIGEVVEGEGEVRYAGEAV